MYEIQCIFIGFSRVGRHPGGIWEAFGGAREPFGGILEALGGSWVALGAFRRHLETPWRLLGDMGAPTGILAMRPLEGIIMVPGAHSTIHYG